MLTTLVLLVRARGITILGLGEQEMSGALMGVMVVAAALATLTMTRIATTPRANSRIALVALMLLALGLLVVGLASGTVAVAVG